MATQNINVAVVNFYGDGSKAFIGAGFSETLSEKLTKLDNVNVMQRESLRPVMNEMGLNINQKFDAGKGQTLGKTVGVDYLVSGTLKEKNNMVKVTYQLFKVKNGTVVAEETLNGNMDHLFDLQGQLAIKIANYFKTPVSDDVKTKLYFMPTQSMASFEKFSSGLRLYEQNRIDEAYGFFLNSIKGDTAFLDAHRYFEYTARKTGKLDDFIKNYESMLSSDPDNPVLMNYLGNAYLDKGNIGKAEELYRKAITIAPTFGNPHNNLATIYVFGKKFKEAIDEFEKGLLYSDRKAPVFYNIGLSYINMGDKDKAKEYFTKALEIDPKNPDFVVARYYIYGVKVVVTSREKKVPGGTFGEVILNSEPVFEIQDSTGGFSPVERAKIVAGRLQNMIADGLKPYEIEAGKVNREVVLKSSSGQVIMTITKKASEREGTTPEKLAKVKLEVLKRILTSSTAVSYSSGGFVLQGTGDKVKDMEGASKEATYLHKGDAYYSEGKLDKALEAYNKALEINSSYAPAYFCLGIVAFDNKDYEKATANFNSAIKSDAKYIEAFIWLGKTYDAQGKETEAKDAFSKALKLDPNNSEAKEYMSEK